MRALNCVPIFHSVRQFVLQFSTVAVILLFPLFSFGEPVLYSGFSFSGRAEDQTKTFPFLSQIAAEKSSDGTAWMDWLFRGIIWENRTLLTSIDLKAGSGSEAGSLKAMAFAMTDTRFIWW